MPLNCNHALLAAVADEMADVRAGVDDLSGLMSELMAHCPTEARSEAVTRAQAFDLVIQRLDGLSGLIAALGAGVPVETALHALTLSDLSDRLSGATPAKSSSVSGDLMLFD
ncbi:hypothetical protein BH10PSE1_BH10PSE1_34870 [soil metagenome]